jgi:hypothetical protein
MNQSKERDAYYEKTLELRAAIRQDRDGDRSVQLAREALDLGGDRAAEQAGFALIAGRPELAEGPLRRPLYYRLNGVSQRMTIAEFIAAGGVPNQMESSDLLRCYVFSGRWEPLPPHSPENTRDASGDFWRLYMAVLKAFIARDKKKIAAAIRRADKAHDPMLAYAIVREARKLGLDPKIKKYDF